MPIRVGMLGAGNICIQFAKSYQAAFPDGKIAAVACSDEKRGEEFRKKYNIEKLYTSYDELLAADDIDLVYVGIRRPLHKELTIKALEKKKAVLCETSLGITLSDVHQMITAARVNKTFLMEAAWSRCTPVYGHIRKALDSGEIGTVKHIQASCEIEWDPLEEHTHQLSGSTLLEIGVFLIQLAFWVIPYKNLREVHAAGINFPSGVDKRGNITLIFKDGVTAFLNYAFDLGRGVPFGRTDACVYGDKGYIEIPSEFWTPTAVIVNGERSEYPISSNEGYIYPNGDNMKYELKHAVECVEKGLLESPLISLDESLALSETMSTILAQLRISYDSL